MLPTIGVRWEVDDWMKVRVPELNRVVLQGITLGWFLVVSAALMTTVPDSALIFAFGHNESSD
jgi:hypothetical protein